MERLNSLWNMVNATANAAASVRDITQQTKTFTFVVSQQPLTVYLQTEFAQVQLKRWNVLQVEVTTRLQMPVGWRFAAEQDDAGVYVVAKRRAMVGGLSSAVFKITVPPHAYIITRLLQSSITLYDLNGTMHVPPDADIVINPQTFSE